MVDTKNKIIAWHKKGVLSGKFYNPIFAKKCVRLYVEKHKTPNYKKREEKEKERSGT